MTREEWLAKWQAACVFVPKREPYVSLMNELKDSDAEQRQQLETLELACGAAVQEAQEQREEIARLREELEKVQAEVEAYITPDNLLD